jgi:hypothetical protein
MSIDLDQETQRLIELEIQAGGLGATFKFTIPTVGPF